MENSGDMTDYDQDADANVAGEALVTINDSGIIPCEFKVLVKDDEDETMRRAAMSNIVVPDNASERYKAGTTTGKIIAMSPAAFSYHDWPKGVRLPQVGDRIVFGRYSGMRTKGRPITNARGHVEQLEYRLLNDKDVAGVLEF
jgi:co-chaperonin GroES (HSP10)